MKFQKNLAVITRLKIRANLINYIAKKVFPFIRHITGKKDCLYVFETLPPLIIS